MNKPIKSKTLDKVRKEAIKNSCEKLDFCKDVAYTDDTIIFGEN